MEQESYKMTACGELRPSRKYTITKHCLDRAMQYGKDRNFILVAWMKGKTIEPDIFRSFVNFYNHGIHYVRNTKYRDFEGYRIIYKVHKDRDFLVTFVKKGDSVKQRVQRGFYKNYPLDK